MAVLNNKLNPIQVHLLQFFNTKKVSDKETADIQRLIALYYAEKADEMMESIWNEKKLEEEKLLKMLEMPLNN